MAILKTVSSPTAVALVLTALSAAVLAVFGLQADRSFPWILLLLLATGAGIAYWAIYAFTGRPAERQAEMVEFTYFIMVIALTLTALPPMIHSSPIGSEPVGLISGCVRTVDKQDLLACKIDQDATASTPSNNQWMLNLGGSVTGQKEVSDKPGSPKNRAFVDGGMTVPFPVLLLALFGGAISLSRRVPELQKRADDSYVAVADAPKLTSAELREKMVFQIIQFVSAPMIAIIAYQAFKPDSETTAAVLAFMCGFGSETVLLMVRNLMDGIKPRLPASATAGYLRGIVTSGSATAAGAQLKIAGTGRSATSDQFGNYEIGEVAPGMQTIEVSFGEQTRTVTMMVSGGATTICNIDLAPAQVPSADTVQLRIGVQDDAIDQGTLTLIVDGKPAFLGKDAVAEVELEANKEHVIEASARSGGRPIVATHRFTPLPSDDARAIELNPM